MMVPIPSRRVRIAIALPPSVDRDRAKGDIPNAVHLSRKSAPSLDLLDLRKT
jgi:hypothetical protein